MSCNPGFLRHTRRRLSVSDVLLSELPFDRSMFQQIYESIDHRISFGQHIFAKRQAMAIGNVEIDG